MKRMCFATLSLVAVAGPAFATVPIPAPVAGAFGPAGLVVAGAAYVGYKIWKKRSGD